jgi:putative membrane protein
MSKILKAGLISNLGAFFIFTSDSLVQWRGYGWHMDPGMMGWGSGMGWLWHIIMMAFWIAVIVGIIFLISWLVVSAGVGGRAAGSQESALEVLKRRYAWGEVNKQEYEEKRRTWGNEIAGIFVTNLSALLETMRG